MILEQLKQNLGDCKFKDKCVCLNNSAYEICTEEEFFIFDPVGEIPSKIVTSNEEYHLAVKNKLKKEIVFVKSDWCLIKEERKCDTILFDNEKVYFVELKKVKLKGRSEAKKDAVAQIESTLKKLNDNKVNYTLLNSFAVICFKSNNIYPIRASRE